MLEMRWRSEVRRDNETAGAERPRDQFDQVAVLQRRFCPDPIFIQIGKNRRLRAAFIGKCRSTLGPIPLRQRSLNLAEGLCALSFGRSPKTR